MQQKLADFGDENVMCCGIAKKTGAFDNWNQEVASMHNIDNFNYKNLTDEQKNEYEEFIDNKLAPVKSQVDKLDNLSDAQKTYILENITLFYNPKTGTIDYKLDKETGEISIDLGYAQAYVCENGDIELDLKTKYIRLVSRN